MSDENQNSVSTEDFEALKAELESIKNKNKELLSEKSKWKQAELTAKEEADSKAAEAAEKSGDIETIKANHAKELAKLQKTIESATNDLKTFKVDNAIKAAITSNNVRPELAEAVEAMLYRKHQFDNGEATIDGKPIAEFAKEYLNSKDGSHFIRAPEHSGGGASGNTNSSGASVSITKDNFSLGAFSQYAKTHGDEAANSLADKLGMPELRV